MLELLQHLGLVDSHSRQANLASIPQARLIEIIGYYRQSRLQAAARLQQRGTDKELRAFLSSLSTTTTEASIGSTCLIYDRVIVDDPLAKLGEPSSVHSNTLQRYLGGSPTSEVNVQAVSDAISWLLKMRPLIEDNAIECIPVSSLHAPPENIPIYYSRDLFVSSLPEHVFKLGQQNLVLSEVEPMGDGGIAIYDRPPASPTRGISIAFRDDSPFEGLPFYLLFQSKFKKLSDDGNFEVEQYLPWDDPPSQEVFDGWVVQSTNRTLIGRLESIAREARLASSFGASYLTESKFEAALLGQSAAAVQVGEEPSVVNFLRANESELLIDDLALVAKIRREHGQDLERLRISLISYCHELSGVGDSFEQRAREMYEKEIRPQVDEIDKAVVRMVGGLGGATLAGAAATMAIATGPSLPLIGLFAVGVLTAVGEGLPTVSEYFAVRRGPAFIWKRFAR